MSGERALVRVIFHADADLSNVHRRVLAILQQGPEYRPGRRAAQFLATAPGLSRLLEDVPEVAFVHGEYPRRKFNNLAAKDYIINAEPVWTEPGLGYTGSGIIAGVNDSGMDLSHPDFPAGSVVAFLGTETETDNAHGTHVTGTVAGRGAASSPNNTSNCGDQTTPLPDARGIAWNASITHNNIFDGGSTTETGMMQWHAQQGADLTNNSWGYTTTYGYLAQTADIDAAVRDADPSTSISDQMTIIFAAGNDGPTSETIGTPGNAKNAITVGASQNDRCGSYVPSNCSGPGIDSMACFSGRGPAQQRIKPDVVAPGSDVLSTESTDPSATNPWEQAWTGSEYALMPGTSMASPVVAGAAAVFMEAHLDRHGAMPSPALVKAALINTATDMGFGFPSMDQGWGRINLRKAIEGPVPDGIRYFDQHEVDHLSTGESWDTSIAVDSSTEPFRVTMTWTDPPGAGGCDPCHINDLDLIITAPDGTVYRGNQFTAAWSEPDPAGRDAINNVENVYVESPVTGEWQIEVASVSTAQNPPDLSGQDFSLVMTGELADTGVLLDPFEMSVCSSEGSVDSTLTLSEQFGGTTDLSVASLPAGASESYSENPVVYPINQSVLTISGLGSVASGSYDIEAIAIDDADPGNTASAFLTLNVDSATPDQTTLQSPADSSAGISLQPSLSWNAAIDASEYRVDIATDSGFSSIVHAATVAGTSYDLPVALNESTTYYWRVTAVNSCGDGVVSSAFSFITESIVQVCSAPNVAIPDGDTAGVSDSLSVTPSENIVDVNLYLRGDHDWVGDLVFSLTHPDSSTQAIVVDQPGVTNGGFGCSADDFDLWLDDEGTDGPVEDQCGGSPPALFGNPTPNEALSVFDGLASDGTWTLNAADVAGDFSGTLAEWCLEISYETAASYTLIYTAGANGSVTGTTPQTVDHGGDGTSVEAVPDANYHFVQWSDGNTANPRTDTNVTSDITVEAEFAIDTYQLTYTAGANGSISGTTPQTVDHGSDGTSVEAVPDTGYHFVQWSDASTANPRTDTNVQADVTVEAEFEINSYTVTFVDHDGSELKAETVDHGSAATAPADPTREGYTFTGWDVPFDNVTGNLTVTAQYEINSYTLTYTVGANGTISGTTTQTVDHGSDGASVEAVPDSGYFFSQWSDGSTENPRTDAGVTSDVTVEAEFLSISVFSDRFEDAGP
nr:S8 family serine peptidase [Wenzhouxiangella sp. XN201]